MLIESTLGYVTHGTDLTIWKLRLDLFSPEERTIAKKWLDQVEEAAGDVAAGNMHDALFIDEILDNVLQHFTIHEDDINAKHRVWKLRLCRRTLAYLARTCKAISSPALDRLWERQSTLMPVLKLLPTFQMIGKGRYVRQFSQVIARTLNIAD